MSFLDRLLWGIAAAALVAGTATAAENTLKAGKWQFIAELQGPPLPPLPPGSELPPGVRIRPDGGINIEQTSCVTPNSQIPGEPPPVPEGAGKPDCKLEKMERNGGDLNWAMTCTSVEGATTHAEGETHYRGDTMEATAHTHTVDPKEPPTDLTQHIAGRYLGACDEK